MTRRTLLVVLVTAATVLVLGTVAARRSALTQPGDAPPGDSPNATDDAHPRRRVTGVEYAAPGGLSLAFDIEYPSGPGPHPVVLFPPHVGNWKAEDLTNDDRYRAVLGGLTARGYAVVVPHYRPLTRHRFPAPIEDGKFLIHYLRANAVRLDLSAARIGAVGASAAGYGLCMLGTTGPDDGFDPPGVDPRAARLQAVVALGSPVDLTSHQWPPVADHLYAVPFFGKSFDDDPGLYTKASPGTYATPDDPPFLLIHSARDHFVPVAQARAFASKLRRAGVEVKLVEEDAVEHVWGGDRLERTVATVTEFLDRHIRLK